MVTALVRLRQALTDVVLPLDLPGAAEQRTSQTELVAQLEDYVIPRMTTIEAPLLAVVGGSTGAGKSTLVNSLVGSRVTTPGLLRPTTRSPVLVHNPADAQWFGQDRLLPDLERVSHSTNDPKALQLVASESFPVGLAVLDAPDVDSVEEQNRLLAAQLLAAADLWIFVTSAARYADQVPWSFLRAAAERSTAVAVVLDRTPADAVQTVATHLASRTARSSSSTRPRSPTTDCCRPTTSPRCAAGSTCSPPTAAPARLS
jgi:energy-coupling factor transporter ATP-binding protein EcfA2